MIDLISYDLLYAASSPIFVTRDDPNYPYYVDMYRAGLVDRPYRNGQKIKVVCNAVGSAAMAEYMAEQQRQADLKREAEIKALAEAESKKDRELKELAAYLMKIARDQEPGPAPKKTRTYQRKPGIKPETPQAAVGTDGLVRSTTAIKMLFETPREVPENGTALWLEGVHVNRWHLNQLIKNKQIVRLESGLYQTAHKG